MTYWRERTICRCGRRAIVSRYRVGADKAQHFAEKLLVTKFTPKIHDKLPEHELLRKTSLGGYSIAYTFELTFVASRTRLT